MVCESAGIRGGTFLAGLPVFVAMVEDAAANDCMPAGFREDLRHALDTFFRPLVELREISFSEPDRGQEDVIEDLCRLRSLVNREVFGHQRAADCVCHKAPLKPEHFRDDGRVVAWIRAAVVEKIAEVKRGRARRRTTIVRPVP